MFRRTVQLSVASMLGVIAAVAAASIGQDTVSVLFLVNATAFALAARWSARQ